MLIPWNIANLANKCWFHEISQISKKTNVHCTQHLKRTIHLPWGLWCTVQSKLLFNFRVTMFNSLWPLCKIELVDSAFAQIIVIESRREFLRRPNLFSPAIIDYIVPNLARHVRNRLVDLNEMCIFFCLVLNANCNIKLSICVKP